MKIQQKKKRKTLKILMKCNFVKIVNNNLTCKKYRPSPKQHEI